MSIMHETCNSWGKKTYLSMNFSEIKKGIAQVIPGLSPKNGHKKRQRNPYALEAHLPVNYYPLDFTWLATGKTYPA